MKKKRVGIITWHYYKNFGSALQAYALQESIKKMGYTVKIIDYRDPRFGYVDKKKDFVKIIINIFNKACLLKRKYDVFYSYFNMKYFKKTKLIQNTDLLKDICKSFDTVICGSDQIWAPNVFNPIYMLSFVPDNIKKISYAASIGLDKIPEDMTSKYASLLSSFDSISVRESKGAELLETNCGVHAEIVLDPTMLINEKEWAKIEKKPELVTDEKYIFCYFLNQENNYKKCVMDFAHKNGYKIIGISAKKADKEWINIVNIGPREFLWLIHNAETIITDSYHGTIFSLLYHKKFNTLKRFLNDDIICQNSRIYQLESYFGLEKNIIEVTDTTELITLDIDYDKFEINLDRLREHSFGFLRKALEE